MRRESLQRVQRFFAILGFAAFFGIAVIVARTFGLGQSWNLPWTGWEPFANQATEYATDTTNQPIVIDVFNQQVALISGHAGSDSGAVCTTAETVTVTEAAVNADVAARAADLLRQAGLDVVILEEYDARLDGLQADAFLSIHADSCIDASGYKAAYYTYSAIPVEEARLVACIDRHYPAVTGLLQHPDTITHNMTEYYAFRKITPSTPAAIIELGFLGGDQSLLTQQSDLVARGVVDSILCFLTDEVTEEPADELGDGLTQEADPAASPAP